MKIITLTDIGVMIFGFLFLVIWLVLYFQGKGNQKMFENLNDIDYPFHEIYFVGYRLSKILGFRYKNKQARNLRKQLAALYEPKYADYYLRVVYAQRLTMALTVMGFAAPLYFISESLPIFFMVLVGGGFTYWYYGKATQDLIKKKMDDILSDFSNVVSKLALLVNSGMTIRNAWEKVSQTSNGLIYDEMRRSVFEMQNGIPIVDALVNFGQRCMLLEIRKFTSTIIQGYLKGNTELAVMLTQQSAEAWELKKQLAKREGELADSKLLLPMCLTFMGILVIVVVPIFSNLGV